MPTYPHCGQQRTIPCAQEFKDEYVALDLPHIPETTRSEMTKELELRFQQLRILLQTFRSE
jgi:hypothetical protein